MNSCSALIIVYAWVDFYDFSSLVFLSASAVAGVQAVCPMPMWHLKLIRANEQRLLWLPVTASCHQYGIENSQQSTVSRPSRQLGGGRRVKAAVQPVWRSSSCLRHANNRLRIERQTSAKFLHVATGCNIRSTGQLRRPVLVADSHLIWSYGRQVGQLDPRRRCWSTCRAKAKKMPAGGTPMAFLTVYLHERLMSFSFSGGCHAPVAPSTQSPTQLDSAQLCWVLCCKLILLSLHFHLHTKWKSVKLGHIYAYFVSATGRIELCDIIIALLLFPFQITCLMKLKSDGTEVARKLVSGLRILSVADARR